jgi:hypothetical protein
MPLRAAWVASWSTCRPRRTTGVVQALRPRDGPYERVLYVAGVDSAGTEAAVTRVLEMLDVQYPFVGYNYYGLPQGPGGVA